MGGQKRYLRYLDHFTTFYLAIFFATSAETERNNETDSMEQNCHALTVTAFHWHWINQTKS